MEGVISSQLYWSKDMKQFEALEYGFPKSFMIQIT